MSYLITTYLVEKTEIENIWNCKDKIIFNQIASIIESEDRKYLQNIIDGNIDKNDAWKLKLLYESLCNYFSEPIEEPDLCVECIMQEPNSFFIPIPDEDDFPGITSISFEDLDSYAKYYIDYLKICHYDECEKDYMQEAGQKLFDRAKQKQKSLVLIFS